jgi:hypothetical protein
MRIAACRPELAGDGVDRNIRIDRLAGAVSLVGQAAHQGDVERQHGTFAEHDHRASRPHRMADAELVKHVCVDRRDFRDYDLCCLDTSNNVFQDVSWTINLVGAIWAKPKLLCQWLNNISVQFLKTGKLHHDKSITPYWICK